MSYIFSSAVLLRCPIQSFLAYTTNTADILLDKSFLIALKIASPSFYHRINEKGDTELTLKEETTLRKYYNRYCFRPTPFGLFSSVTLTSWGHAARLTLADQTEATIYPDQAYVHGISEHLLKTADQDQQTYVINPTLYKCADEYRFITTTLDPVYQKRSYLLQSIAYSRLILNLATFTAFPKTRGEIEVWIEQKAHCSRQESMAYFDFLADAQILLSTDRPPITGVGYLERLKDKYQAKNLFAGTRIKGPIKAEQIQEIQDSLQLPETASSGQNRKDLNVISYRPVANGSLDQQLQDQLREALAALHALCLPERNAEMDQFIKKYQQHFEGQSIPLLTALDPESGIGHQLPVTEQANVLLETINLNTPEEKESCIEWSSAHQLLLNRWHSGAATVIQLQEEDIQPLLTAKGPLHIGGMSILFRQTVSGLFVETAGGVNSTGLMGRFTLAQTSIKAAAQEMARYQEELNPEVIFAEILHLTDSHTDNINRRENIWSWEIPLTAPGTGPGSNQLALDDLYLYVENGKVFLRSASQNKIVVPRLSSAYNFSQNKLPLFRFLAALSYQYSRSSLAFELSHYFPGLRYYPRVCYQNTILHPATWILSGKELKAIQAAEQEQIIARFHQLKESLQLPKVIALSEGDQQLVFFTDRKEDILFLAACVKNADQVILNEYPEPDPDMVKSISGEPLAHQFNAFILPDEPFPFRQPHLKHKIRKVRRKFIPGSEWLYLKIYTPAIHAGKLLLKLYPLLNRTYSKGCIQKWFFIRYHDHAPHIRLRIQLNPEILPEILSKL